MRLSFHKTGNPAEVLQLEECPTPAPQRHEVRVRMLYAPINPADLNFIEGTYGKLPHLPAVPGNEGCGRVEAVGDEVESLAVGDLVIPLYPIGTWTQQILAAENQFARLPADLDPVQASMLRVNPTTAWHMLHQFRQLKKGDFVAQNASNSGVGRAVIEIAKHLELRTLNFVRRPELISELKALGADEVLLDQDDQVEAAKQLLKGRELTLALNAVGGDSAVRLMEILSPGGALVTYGAMSRRSLKVPNKYLIFKDLELRGCWITRSFEQASHKEIHDVLHPIVDLMRKGALKLPVQKVYPIAEYKAAMAAAAGEARNGKIVLEL
jgi:trans-2-enoyl-CoA reductase